MKITSLDTYQYKLPFIKPLKLHGIELESREGLIVHLKAEGGFEGFGEIAPLPGFSQESLHDCLSQLKGLHTIILQEEIPEQISLDDQPFEKWFEGKPVNYSLRFGLEMAVLNLIAAKNQSTLGELLNEDCHSLIRINGLLQGDKATVVTLASQYIDEGYTALKLKVGPDIDEAIDKVKALSEVINGRALLHLDANRSWDLNGAIKFGEEVGLAAVDYIEEPFKDPEQVAEFFMKTTIPVALDESVLNLPFDEIRQIDGVDLVILKPTILGGIEKVWNISAQAKRAGISAVISSSFESDLGILALANIAGCDTRDHSAGLDTLKWFEDLLLKEPLLIERGKMNIQDRVVNSEGLNFELLDHLEL